MVPQCPVIPVTPSRIFQLVTLVVLTWILFFSRVLELLPHSLMCSGKAWACLYRVGVV